MLGGVIAVAGLLGDLFESAIKRDMNVKDTGRLLAGHGGMLDRIDALLFAGPACPTSRSPHLPDTGRGEAAGTRASGRS